MLENNLFRVINEKDIDEILILYQNTMIIILYNTKKNDHYLSIGKEYIDISGKIKDCLFLFVDVNEFEISENKYDVNNITEPIIEFYFNKALKATLDGFERTYFIESINSVSEYIEKEQVAKKNRGEKKNSKISNRPTANNPNTVMQTQVDPPIEEIQIAQQLMMKKMMTELNNNIDDENINIDNIDPETIELLYKKQNNNIMDFDNMEEINKNENQEISKKNTKKKKKIAKEIFKDLNKVEKIQMIQQLEELKNEKING